MAFNGHLRRIGKERIENKILIFQEKDANMYLELMKTFRILENVVLGKKYRKKRSVQNEDCEVED